MMPPFIAVGEGFLVADRPEQARRIAFISSNSIGWGGSEELWSAAAAELAADGHDVAAMKPGMGRSDSRVLRLKGLGVRLADLRRIPLLPERLVGLMVRFSWLFEAVIRASRLSLALRAFRPGLIVLSQGGNGEGLFYAKRILRLGTPYVLIVQKVAEMYWPADEQLPDLRSVYAGARRCLFVSEHNLRLHEEQLGMKLANAEVVRNPFLVPWEEPAPWPGEEEGLRLACVGRLYPREKGQDILLRVLARDRWRERPVSLSFFGAGAHLEGLKATATYLGLANVSFAGFATDVAAIWRDHHALLLPSHCEGLPLALVEAMLSGRVAIVTNVAGHAEIVEDGATGFLAAAPTDDYVDEALERAWQRRSEWRAIGEAAAARARALVPPRPERLLADKIAAWAGEGRLAPDPAPGPVRLAPDSA
jgi:glycosyltransferase involved in cell wall biosynthesis